VRIALLAAALLALAACADPASSRIDSANALSRAVDHDTETTLPSADSNLRAIPPGRPPPVENGWGAAHF
jgi:hypothetical protein